MFHVTAETRARLVALREVRDTANREIETTIRKAREEGGSLREIADIIGLSHTEIRRILQQQQESPK